MNKLKKMAQNISDRIIFSHADTTDNHNTGLRAMKKRCVSDTETTMRVKYCLQRGVYSYIGSVMDRVHPNLHKIRSGLMDRVALSLVIIGALNWASIGIFSFDVIAWLFGGQSAAISRVIYTIVGLAGIWCFSLLFREREVLEHDV